MLGLGREVDREDELLAERSHLEQWEIDEMDFVGTLNDEVVYSGGNNVPWDTRLQSNKVKRTNRFLSSDIPLE